MRIGRAYRKVYQAGHQMKLRYHTMTLAVVTDLSNDHSSQLKIGQCTCTLCSDLLFASHNSASSFTPLVMYERKVFLHETLGSLYLLDLAVIQYHSMATR